MRSSFNFKYTYLCLDCKHVNPPCQHRALTKELRSITHTIQPETFQTFRDPVQTFRYPDLRLLEKNHLKLITADSR